MWHPNQLFQENAGKKPETKEIQKKWFEAEGGKHNLSNSQADAWALSLHWESAAGVRRTKGSIKGRNSPREPSKVKCLQDIFLFFCSFSSHLKFYNIVISFIKM